MQEKPKVTVSRGKRADTTAKEFNFTQADVPSASGLASFRAGAWDAFQKISLPVATDEAWRRTDLRLLPTSDFKLPKAGAFEDLPVVPEELLKPLTGEQHGGQITLLPGGSNVDLDESLAKKGVVFTDFRTAEKNHADLLKKLVGQVVKPEDGKFAALASALSENGVLLYVPKGVQVEQPLHSVLWGPGSDLAHFSHLIVYVEDGASVTYVHEAASPDEVGHAMHAGVVEIYVGKDANLRFVELQSWGRHVWNFSHERARVDRGGNLDWIFGAVGSRLTKNFSDLDLAGEGAQGRMSGFYFTDGTQHLDHDTQQNHLAPHCTSDLLFKGALKGKSRSVWQGMIYVAPAHKRPMATKPTATSSSMTRRAQTQFPVWKFLPTMCAVHMARPLVNLSRNPSSISSLAVFRKRKLNNWWWKVSLTLSCSASHLKVCVNASSRRSRSS